MDKTVLRQQALSLATMKAAADATTDDILADADKVLAWLTKDMTESVPSEPAQHESAAAVAGQEPKGA